MSRGAMHRSTATMATLVSSSARTRVVAVRSLSIASTTPSRDVKPTVLMPSGGSMMVRPTPALSGLAMCVQYLLNNRSACRQCSSRWLLAQPRTCEEILVGVKRDVVVAHHVLLHGVVLDGCPEVDPGHIHQYLLLNLQVQIAPFDPVRFDLRLLDPLLDVGVEVARVVVALAVVVRVQQVDRVATEAAIADEHVVF